MQGAPPSKRPLPDRQPVAPTGEFLLGYPNQNDGAVYRVTPPVLSTNSSFAAFGLLEQDVAGFEAWLASAAPQTGIDPELLAAKVCGRWRTGVALVLSPDTGTPDPPLAPERINDFDYVSSDPVVNDTFGYRCPIGSHMRHRQFELVMSKWVNESTFVKSVRGPDGANPVKYISGQDVLLGVNDPASSSFTLSKPPNQKLTGFGPFVTTRGGAYCYLPSITALRFISAQDHTGR